MNKKHLWLGFLILMLCTILYVFHRPQIETKVDQIKDAVDTTPRTRILFIGNSYTFVNDLPRMLTRLAEAGNHKIYTEMTATGGWTLRAHSTSAQTLNHIKSSKWDFVVLQEQSEIPSNESLQNSEMFPAARILVNKIREIKATPVFFITWAHLGGWPENNIKDYETMQTHINEAYMKIAQETHSSVAPVGYAWEEIKNKYPTFNLWRDDGSHPSEQGTYLAACVFYATLFHQSPEGLVYRANIASEDAAILQTAAAHVQTQATQ